MTSQSIGFIGVGVMGEPMCRNMATKTRLPTRAFDLNKEALARLSSHGVQAQNSIEDVVTNSDFVFFSLPSGDVLKEIIYGERGVLALARPGQIFVDLSTTQVKLTREIADAITKRGAVYFDSPVARTREAAEAGTLAITVGGPEAHFDKIKPLLACVANEVVYCGSTGSGQILKLLNNMIVFEIVGALAEAIAIGEAAGMSGQFLFETLSKSSADSFALRNHGMKSMVPRVFPERAFSVRYALKDLDYALELSKEMNVQVEGALVVKQRFEQAIEKGWGDQYHPVVSRLLRK